MQTETRPVRLAKFLSDAGVASRRHAEEMILEGRVLVNDEVVCTLPAFVVPGVDQVVANGERVATQKLEYFVVHKPRGFLCTDSDPSGRQRVADLLPPKLPRMFPVGRLEMDTAGLVLMTNDGELAQRIAHPRFGVGKIYRAEVAGRVGPALRDELMRGVYLSEGKASASDVEIVHSSSSRSILDITLHDARNRQVHRMLARCGHPVRRLTRVRIGPISLKGLPLGASRRLADHELAALRRAVEAPQPRRGRPQRNPTPAPDGERRDGAKKQAARPGGQGRPAVQRRSDRANERAGGHPRNAATSTRRDRSGGHGGKQRRGQPGANRGAGHRDDNRPPRDAKPKRRMIF